jgi:hypothetical protein
MKGWAFFTDLQLIENLLAESIEAVSYRDL